MTTSNISSPFDPPRPALHSPLASLPVMNRAPRRRTSGQRERLIFALRLKFLLRTLEKAECHDLLHRARQVIATCTQRNRQGDPLFTPLESTLTALLKTLVGPESWRQSERCVKVYLARKYYQQQMDRQCIVVV